MSTWRRALPMTRSTNSWTRSCWRWVAYTDSTPPSRLAMTGLLSEICVAAAAPATGGVQLICKATGVPPWPPGDTCCINCAAPVPAGASARATLRRSSWSRICCERDASRSSREITRVAATSEHTFCAIESQKRLADWLVTTVDELLPPPAAPPPVDAPRPVDPISVATLTVVSETRDMLT